MDEAMRTRVELPSWICLILARRRTVLTKSVLGWCSDRLEAHKRRLRVPTWASRRWRRWVRVPATSRGMPWRVHGARGETGVANGRADERT